MIGLGPAKIYDIFSEQPIMEILIKSCRLWLRAQTGYDSAWESDWVEYLIIFTLIQYKGQGVYYF